MTGNSRPFQFRTKVTESRERKKKSYSRAGEEFEILEKMPEVGHRDPGNCLLAHARTVQHSNHSTAHIPGILESLGRKRQALKGHGAFWLSVKELTRALAPSKVSSL